MDDFIATGSVVHLEGDWYYDIEAKQKFRIDDKGQVLDERGNVILRPDQGSDVEEGV